MRVLTGRVERRIAKTQVVELVPASESPIAKVEGVTENVSPRGARVITDSVCAPGKIVRLDAAKERVNLARARGLLSSLRGRQICCWSPTGRSR